MQRGDGLHPRQINGVVGVLELIKVFSLNGELTYKLWGAVPNAWVGIGEGNGLNVTVFENIRVAHR